MKKYNKWYNQIIESSRNRVLDSYREKHHVIPKSLGGTDDVDNIVELTAREHFVCHWLLTKIYDTGDAHWKMLNALRIMRAENNNQQRYETKITARVYAKLKEEYSVLQSERIKGINNPMYGDKFCRSEEGRKKQKEAVLGDKNGSKTLEARKKIAESKLGKKREAFSDEWRDKLSKAKAGENNNMYGKTHTEETKKLMRQKALGKKQSEDTIKKKADAIRGLKREKKLCIHCNKLVSVNGYARWHGNNCKSR